jgi:hypothetical protein
MKKIIIISVIFGLVSVPVVFAQTDDSANTLIPAISNILPVKMPPTEKIREQMLKEKREREELRSSVGIIKDDTEKQIEAVREATREQAESIREDLKNKSETVREAMKKEIEATQEVFKIEKEQILKALPQDLQEAKKMLQERRDVFQTEMEAKKETLKTSVEAQRAEMEKVISAAKEALKVKIGQFKDQKKKQVAERVNTSLNEVNKNSVNRFMNNINELDKAIVNITTRAEKAAVSGKDTSAVMNAIQNAKNAVESARNAVAVQAGKAYSVVVTNEINVANDLKSARDLLSTDLKFIQENNIKVARDAVWSALVELQKIPSVNDSVISTTTNQGTTESKIITQ